MTWLDFFVMSNEQYLSNSCKPQFDGAQVVMKSRNPRSLDEVSGEGNIRVTTRFPMTKAFEGETKQKCTDDAQVDS